MTTIDKILKRDSINEILQELDSKKEDIDGIFVLYFTDNFGGYHARERSSPPHLLIGALTIMLDDLRNQGLEELNSEE